MSHRVVHLTAEQTHPLRRTVLRDGTASDVVVFDGDDEPSTFHLGAVDDSGTIVAISTWMRRPFGEEPNACQLRGMATSTTERGGGIGAALLAAGLTECASRGASVVWARARVSALGFYLRHGFTADGDEYVDATTGLPHIDISRSVARQ